MNGASEKSTNEIRMIAEDVVSKHAEICEVKRDNLARQLADLTAQVKSNATTVASLLTTIATMSATVTPLCQTVKEHSGAIEKLNGRPAVWAAIGAALPTLLGVLLWWFSK